MTFLSSCNPPLDLYECVNLLILKKNKRVMVPDMTNETYSKWERCCNVCSGPATASLICAERKSI